LSALTVAELGFSNGATAGEIFEAAKKIGLELCPAGVGPYLRLQFLDQTVGNLVIAMEPVESSDGNLLFFGVVNDGDGLWLCDYYGFPDRYWNARDRFVFVKPN
jgi:hypothetical protein